MSCKISMLRIFVVLVGLATNVMADGQIESRPLVEIKNGMLLGIESKGMFTFKDIPYAAPPIGELRWNPPQPSKNWSDVRDASQFGKSCIQPLVRGLNDELMSESEDCLKLNVYTPKTGKKLPVMVWFHGGGLVEGSASEPYYQPVGLTKEGVIVVTVDYRLGKLGFFAPKELVAEAKNKDLPVGNYGIMDQIYSLKWVRDNIASFGGDPNNVTIFGQSAGGRSVTWLMTSPAAKGLFHKAIAQSAQQLPLRDLSQEKFGMFSEESLEEKYIKAVGVSSLKELRALPAEQLLVTPREFQNGEFGGAFVDGKIVIGDPIPLFAAGKQYKVPFMIGTNSWDASYFVLGQPPVDAYLKKTGEDPEQIEKLYSSFQDKCVLSAEIMADGWYKGATKLLANSANKSAPSYAYYFNYLTPNIRASHIGAAHTFELPYLFGDLDSVLPAPFQPESGGMQCTQIEQALLDMKTKATWSSYWYPTTAPDNQEDQSISQQLAKSWTSFAKTGNPNYGGKNNWHRYDIKNDSIREFTQGKEGVVNNLDKSKVDYQIKAINAIYQTK